MPIQPFKNFIADQRHVNPKAVGRFYLIHPLRTLDKIDDLYRVITAIAKEIVDYNLNVMSIGYGNGLVEQYFKMQLDNNQISARVVGIGKQGSRYDTGYENPILDIDSRVDLPEDFVCTEESIKKLYKEEILPKIDQEDFEKTVLFFSMPPMYVSGTAYYISIYMDRKGDKLAMYTEGQGDGSMCTPIVPSKVLEGCLDKLSLSHHDATIFNGPLGPVYFGFSFSNFSQKALDEINQCFPSESYLDAKKEVHSDEDSGYFYEGPESEFNNSKPLDNTLCKFVNVKARYNKFKIVFVIFHFLNFTALFVPLVLKHIYPQKTFFNYTSYLAILLSLFGVNTLFVCSYKLSSSFRSKVDEFTCRIKFNDYQQSVNKPEPPV